MEYSKAARSKMVEWKQAGVLRKYVLWGRMLAEEAVTGLDKLWDLGIARSYPSRELDRATLNWAARLGQVAAYDAAYVALAERLGAESWTADKQLALACNHAGLDWVRQLQW